MKYEEKHISDEHLLLDIEGELPAGKARATATHLEDCWTCRARRQELENAVAEFVRAYRGDFERELPGTTGPRAMLKARLEEVSRSVAPRLGWSRSLRVLALTLGICVTLVLGQAIVRATLARAARHLRGSVVFLPDSRLTPGAALLVDRIKVCAEPNTKNKAVTADMRREVFAEYGIAGADPGMYEVDYLVTPALGGADDIHNLWPHSYISTVWNAKVKDDLEDRLRDMVCDGNLDLAEAQREIAMDWISAYKKYFHTDRPIEVHCERCREPEPR